MKTFMMIASSVCIAVAFDRGILAPGIMLAFYAVEEIIIQSKRFK